MTTLSPLHWLHALKREWLLYHLGDERFRFMWDPPPTDEWVALDCETTGLNVRSDEIISIGAVRIAGDRILTSERLQLLVRPSRRRISADSVRVHGTLDGKINSNTVTLAKSAKVVGDITHETLEIEAGAHLEGHLIRKAPQAAQTAIAAAQPKLAPPAEMQVEAAQ
ncbi:MAG TPA: exonuclease domain-containing protein [Magnetospirillum sp.]|nr:exonuclease domain-containing protein [Magnetospirillum sp.]